MFSNIKAGLLTAFLATLVLSSPIVPGPELEAAPVLDARTTVSYNLTTHPHKFCIGHTASTNYAGSSETCIGASGKSIKLYSVAEGCKVTANDHPTCGGILHHHVTKGCNDIKFKSIRIRC